MVLFFGLHFSVAPPLGKFSADALAAEWPEIHEYQSSLKLAGSDISA